MHFPSKYIVPLFSAITALLLACGDSALIPVSPPASTGFSVERLLSEEYLVVRISVRADDIKTGAVTLTRGPKKTNSAIADLMVIATAGEQEIGAYAMPDPRFQRIEGSSWRTVESADTFIFIPLSADIDKVVIRPVRGREHVATKRYEFDPQPLAEDACEAAARRYSEAETPNSDAGAPLAGTVAPYTGAVTRSSEIVTIYSEARTPYDGCDRILARMQEREPPVD